MRRTCSDALALSALLLLFPVRLHAQDGPVHLQQAAYELAQTGLDLQAEAVYDDAFFGVLRQVQTGEAHAAFIQAAADAQVTQVQGDGASDRENVAEVRGVGAGTTVAQTQTGSFNVARLVAQDGLTAEHASVIQLQQGSHNTSVVDGFFSEAGSPGALFSIEQHGDYNTAVVHNNGWAHNRVQLFQTSTAASAADGNSALVTFSSSGNVVAIRQTGQGNTAVVRQ